MKSYKLLVAERRCFCEQVAEELTMSGFPSKQVDDEVVIDTIAGTVTVSPNAALPIMSEVYRAICNVGMKLSAWGLKSKLIELKLEDE